MLNINIPCKVFCRCRIPGWNMNRDKNISEFS